MTVFRDNQRHHLDKDREIRKLKKEIADIGLKWQSKEELKGYQEEGYGDKYIMTLDMEKEIQMQEMLIKGYQKENERLVEENKKLKDEVLDVGVDMYEQGKTMTNFKNKLIQGQGNFLVKKQEPSINELNTLAGGILIDQNELTQARQEITRLQQ